MTVGVGGSTAEAELAAMKNMRGDVPPVGVDERLRRIARAQVIMREKGIDALYLDVSSSMTYFTGLKFRRTEIESVDALLAHDHLGTGDAPQTLIDADGWH